MRYNRSIMLPAGAAAALLLSLQPSAFATPPNEEGDEWHLKGPSSFAGGANFEAAWTAFGNHAYGVTIGVMDTPYDHLHLDLDFLDPPDVTIFDEHGTGVVGLILAAHNDIFIRGAASLATLRFASNQSAANTFYSDAGLAGRIDSTSDGAAAHSNSWYPVASGVPLAWSSLSDTRAAIADAHSTGRSDKGVAFIVAAGNESTSIARGAALFGPLPTTIAVGSVESGGLRGERSNFGPWLDLVAPGVAVRTLAKHTDDPPTGELRTASGTSYAAPLAAAAIALAAGENPDLEAEQLRRILQHTARRTDHTGLAGLGHNLYHPLYQFSSFYGYGMLDAFEAVTAADESTSNGGFTYPAPPTGLQLTRDFSDGEVSLSWTNATSPIIDPFDPNPSYTSYNGEYSSAMVVRYPLDDASWLPEQGVAPGSQTPPSGVVIVDDGNFSTAEDSVCDAGDSFVYAVFTVNEVNNYSFPIVALAEGKLKYSSATAPGSPRLGPDDSGFSIGQWSIGWTPGSGTGRPVGWGSATPDITVSALIDPALEIDDSRTVLGTNPISHPIPGVVATIDDGVVNHTVTSPVMNIPDVATRAALRFDEILEVWGILTATNTDTRMYGRLEVLDPDDNDDVIATLLDYHMFNTYDWRAARFDLDDLVTAGHTAFKFRWTLVADKPLLVRDNPIPYDFSVFELAGWQLSDIALEWDECLPEDVNGDGVVDQLDVDIVTNSYGACGCHCPADVNGDGVVNGSDLGLVLGKWSATCEP